MGMITCCMCAELYVRFDGRVYCKVKKEGIKDDTSYSGCYLKMSQPSISLFPLVVKHHTLNLNEQSRVDGWTFTLYIQTLQSNNIVV